MTELKNRIVDELKKVDAECATRFSESFTFAEGSGLNEITQINRYWRRELSKVNVSTANERSYLQDNVDKEVYVKHFIDHVHPTLKKYGLPNK